MPKSEIQRRDRQMVGTSSINASLQKRRRLIETGLVDLNTGAFASNLNSLPLIFEFSVSLRRKRVTTQREELTKRRDDILQNIWVTMCGVHLE